MTKHALLAPGGVLGRADDRRPSKGRATPEASGSRHVPERRCRLPARASARGLAFAPCAVAAPRPRARCPTRCSRWSHAAASFASASMRAWLVASDADHARARMAISGTFRPSPTTAVQAASGPSASIVPRTESVGRHHPHDALGLCREPTGEAHRHVSRRNRLDPSRATTRERRGRLAHSPQWAR